tara:strand:- start:91 stop:372 length:282 start_codon:yes stop_codon:yes gene_type:complete
MAFLKKTTIDFIISLITLTVVFTYFYPWLYNQINHITKRGKDIDESIDFVNALIMFFILYLSPFGPEFNFKRPVRKKNITPALPDFLMNFVGV